MFAINSVGMYLNIYDAIRDREKYGKNKKLMQVMSLLFYSDEETGEKWISIDHMNI